MSVIEGIGDEVLLCGVVLGAFILLVLAWSSTSVGDQHFLGRVSIIIERNLGHANAREGTVEDDGRRDNQENEARTTEGCAQSNVPQEDATPQATVTVHPPDDISLLRERRLKLFKPRTENTSETETTDDAEKAEETAKENVTEKMEGTGKTQSDETPDHPEITEEEQDESTLESIRIKLKYLNDTQRLVNGRLEEKLGEFKQRHFAGELSGNKLVKLIFNGRLLRSDADTLRSCGLFDQCVIHCHVTQPPAASSGEPLPDGDQHELDLDLGHLMLPLFCILIALLWFFWFEFARLFTATATFALVSITALLFVSLLALYPAERILDFNFFRRN